MTVNALLLLFLTLFILLVAAVVTGVIGYGVARLCGASNIGAVSAGSFTLCTVLTLGIALLNVLVPLLIK